MWNRTEAERSTHGPTNLKDTFSTSKQKASTYRFHSYMHCHMVIFMSNLIPLNAIHGANLPNLIPANFSSHVVRSGCMSASMEGESAY